MTIILMQFIHITGTTGTTTMKTTRNENYSGSTQSATEGTESGAENVSTTFNMFLLAAVLARYVIGMMIDY